MNELELTILSLVAEAPRTSGELIDLIEARGLREWLAVGSSSLYYVLSRLERHELLRRQPGVGEADTVFALTEAGRGVLQTAIAELLRRPHALGMGIELGLANLSVLKPPQVYQALTQHRAELKHGLAAVRATWERIQTDASDSLQGMYTHAIAMMQAELAWLNEFIDYWRARYPAVERTADEPASEEPNTPSARTQVHRRTQRNDGAKQIQRLKRPGTRE